MKGGLLVEGRLFGFFAESFAAESFDVFYAFGAG